MECVHLRVGALGAQKRVGSTEVRITDGCEPPDLDRGDGTQVVGKDNIFS